MGLSNCASAKNAEARIRTLKSALRRRPSYLNPSAELCCKLNFIERNSTCPSPRKVHVIVPFSRVEKSLCCAHLPLGLQSSQDVKMWCFTLYTLLLAGLSHAYPQVGGNGTCATSTYTDILVDTTYIYTYTSVDYIYPESTQTLTPTTVTYDSSTTITVETVTSTDTVCTVEPIG